jgi:hypothetical protein
MDMEHKQILSEIIVTNTNVIPVVQQHEEALPIIKDELKKIGRMNWTIIILLAVTLGEKALQWIRL